MKIKINDEIIEIPSSIKKPSEEILNATFSVFTIQDYKGGELSSNVNVDYNSVCYDLTDEYKCVGLLDNEVKVSPKELAGQLATPIRIEHGEYACCDGFVGEIYIHKNGLLENVGFDLFQYGLLQSEIQFINDQKEEYNLNIEILEI